MLRHRRWGTFVLLIGLGAEPAAAAPPRGGIPAASAGTTRAATPLPSLHLTRHQLPNGLRVVLNEDHTFPTVAICVTYNVGARDERPGQRGFAHLFEHMMFEGSRNVEKGEHFKLIAGHGGRANGTTSTERTNFFQVLPAPELELGLWLEADRMKSLAVTRRKFENQRAVVQEEYRMRVSNQAYGLGYLRLNELAFQGYPTYGHTPIGSMEDLDLAEVEWVQAFHDTYYAPNNAVLTVSGDFESASALALIEKHFSAAEPRSSIPRVELPPMHKQTSERLSVLEDKNAKTPGVFFGWVIPAAKSPEHDALDLAARVLASGESSALHQLLVRKEALARSASAWVSQHRGPSLFAARMVLSPSGSIDKAQKIFEGELRRLATAGPTISELEKVKRSLRAGRLFKLQQNQDRAILLGDYETLWGDPALVVDEIGRYDALTPADVRKAIATYLIPHRRTIVEVYPPGWVKDEYPAVLQHAYIVKKGDSLIRIASEWGVPLADLLKENELKRNQTIYPGQKLMIPKGGRPPGKATPPAGTPKGTDKTPASPGRAAPTAPKAPPPRTHRVKEGDTLIGIAKRYGVTVASIQAANPRIGPKKRIFIGQTLSIPPKAP
jgi:zinc protease